MANKSLKIFAFHGETLFQTSGSWDKIFVYGIKKEKKVMTSEWFRVFSKKSALHGLVNEVPVALELGKTDDTETEAQMRTYSKDSS